MTAQGFTAVGTHVPDALFAGSFPAVTRKRTLTGAAALPRGAVLGRITASGKLTLSLAAAEDGSEEPCEILATDADPSGGDVEVVTYLTGEFAAAALQLGAGHTAASIREALRRLSIFI